MNMQKLGKLKSKAYRHAYVASHIDQGMAFQIRALRESRGWDQKQLAAKIGLKSQSAIARVEDPSYGKLSISTIKKLAKAFDVGILVKFVPFSRVLTETANLSSVALAPVGFEEELPALETSIKVLSTIGAYTTFSTVNSASNYGESGIVGSPSTSYVANVKLAMEVEHA
jgi:transcriptional regulator with XRE-family HTH domain